MVEGPKVVIKTKKLKALEGQRLQEASANLSHVNGLKLASVSRVFCVGKELFIVFDRVAIRLHFGMNGTEVVVTNAMDLNHVIKQHTTGRKKFVGAIRFDSDTLLLYDSTIQVKHGMDIDISESRLIRDVMSSTFNVDSVLEYLCTDDRKIMDAIMDQMILPGVGNVIKCEALFLSSINPNVVARDVPMRTLAVLLGHLQAFSKRWYACSVSRRQVDKAVYGRDSCSRCSGKVSLVRDGEAQRITYFCALCQSGVPSTQSTTGHVAVKPTTALSAWLSNSTRRREVDKEESDDHQGRKRVSLPERENEPPLPDPNSEQHAQSATLSRDDARAFTFFRQPCCVCPRSAKPAALQRVRKIGCNHGRLFWACGGHGGSSASGCGLFRWADDHFPRCSCATGGSDVGRTVMRRVLKPGENNGRYFFSCRNSGSSGEGKGAARCGFFFWADEWSHKISAGTISTNAPPTSYFTVPL